MKSSEARKAISDAKKKKVEKEEELIKQYKEEVYNPEIKRITEECEHDGQHIGVMMASHTYCYIRCCGCQKTLWEGNPDEIPKHLNYKWSQNCW